MLGRASLRFEHHIRAKDSSHPRAGTDTTSMVPAAFDGIPGSGNEHHSTAPLDPGFQLCVVLGGA